METHNTHILVMDDDVEISKMLQNALTLKNYKTTVINDPKAYPAIFDLNPDLVLLDINMPEMDGYQVCQKIRAVSEVPILFLTARSMEEDQIKGLLIGADDYITKPFSIEILYARIHAHLSKSKRQEPIVKRGFRIDYAHREVYFDEVNIVLTKTEFDILELLSTNPKMVFDKERIYTRLWGFDALGDSAVVAEHVRNLRKKLNKHLPIDKIETVWGVGYKWIG